MSIRWLVVLLFPIALQAAPMETMAWHFAAMPSLVDLKALDDNRAAPPAIPANDSSSFISKGQQIVDLSQDFRSHYKLDAETSLIWNETRKLLIAHAPADTIVDLENLSDFNRQPRQVVLTFSWYLGIEPGKPVPGGTQAVHQSTVTARSGQAASLKCNSPSPDSLQAASIHASPILSEDRNGVDLEFDLQWQEQKDGRVFDWSYSASMSFDDRQQRSRICMQLESPSGLSWTIAVGEQLVLTDGYPVRSSKLLLKQQKETEYGDETALLMEPLGIQTSKGRIPYSIFSVPPDFLQSASNIDSGKQQLITIPNELKSALPKRLIDLRDKLGIPSSSSGFVGFEPTKSLVYAVGLDENDQETIKLFFEGGSCRNPNYIQVFVDLELSNPNGEAAHRRTVMVSRSGRKSELICKIGMDNEAEKLVVAPTFGNNDREIDLLHDLKFQSPSLYSATSLTLPAGTVVRSSALKNKSGQTLTLSWKASIISPDTPN